jgi:hypothetical protein
LIVMLAFEARDLNDFTLDEMDVPVCCFTIVCSLSPCSASL